MEIENQSSTKRRVSFVPVNVNEVEDDIYEPSIIEQEKEDLKRRREQKQVFTQNHLPSSKPNIDRSSRIDEIYSNIIRMANENKINQKNTWNLDLINHMEDVILNGSYMIGIHDKRNSDSVETNFQKASTTLDASIKIYGYRVDDTLNTGYRILDSINRGEEVKPQAEVPKQSKKLGVVNTIESNLRSIQMDSSEMSYEADPLFHIMSRRFDEGGVKGLLLSNLGVTDGWNVVFDSNEIVEIEECPHSKELDDMNKFVDIQSLFKKDLNSNSLDKPPCSALFPLLEEIEHYEEGCTDLEEEYAREVIEREELSVLEDLNVEFDKELVPIPVLTGHINNENENDNNNDNDNWETPDMDLPSAGSPPPISDSMEVEVTTNTSQTKEATERTNQIERLILTSKSTNYQYFQPSLLIKTWAGPSHWKINKVSKPKKKQPPKESHKTKKAPLLSFSPEQTINPAEAFAPVKRRSDLVISDAQFTSQRNPILPEDHHYQFSNLIKLNCRSDIELQRVVNFNVDTSQEYDLSQWEIDPRNVDIGGCILENPMDILNPRETAEEPSPMEEVMSDNGAPNDIGFDEPSHAGFISDIEESGIHSLIEADRVVKRISIAYATQATQVDIQELKDTMWSLIEDRLQKGSVVVLSDVIREINQQRKEEIANQLFFISILHISFRFICIGFSFI